ncbi:MAG: hypothetical protein EOM67_06465 [Spirochaetia bacterium]|nr:hypothetical protein [Spirochaetia bacterium]
MLKKLFESIDTSKIEFMVIETPAGQYARLIGFLYERVSGTKLDHPEEGLFFVNYDKFRKEIR